MAVNHVTQLAVCAWSENLMQPEYPSFKPLGPEDNGLLAEYLALSPRSICDLTVTNLNIWRECESPSFTFVNENLCILIDSHNEPRYFLQPLGENDIAGTMEICLRHAGRVSRVQESVAQSLSSSRFNVVAQRDYFDYVYEVQELAELKGKKFDGKRNQIRKFSKNYVQYRFERLTPEHAGAALSLFDRWSLERENGNGGSESSPPPNHVCQRRAIERAFANFLTLGLRGGAVIVDGEMQGFIAASAESEKMVTAHLQYANYKMAGIYQVLLWETCRNVFAEFELLNLEEDLGIPGLRKTKLSYQPLRLEKKFLVTLR